MHTPSDPGGGMGHSKNWFSYEELIKATNGFSTLNLLGEGGFGSVYKGILPDGREIAVKQLKIGGSQGEREFKAEVDIISRIHHRHLVSLVGYCIQDNRKILVYDYVPNNTLYFHLHGKCNYFSVGALKDCFLHEIFWILLIVLCWMKYWNLQKKVNLYWNGKNVLKLQLVQLEE